jgi:signal transduction histidine kinase
MQKRMNENTQELTRESNVEPRVVDQRMVEQRIVEPRGIEQRLARMKNLMDNPGGPLEGVGEDFGEVLRHELNNPLTGILGNAELLLAEVRRGNDGRLPPGGLQRLETIAALAVRLRETIRRLSQQWEVRDAALRKKNDM